MLQVVDKQQLITEWVFRYIRHPVYAGSLLVIIGFYIAFQIVFLLVAITLTYFVIIRYRLLFKEQLLLGEFGEEYREYMKVTKALIPLIY